MYFNDFYPGSFYPSPFDYGYNYNQPKRSPLNIFANSDINNNDSTTMNRQKQAQMAEAEKQRQAQFERERQQRRRPKVFRPKPFEATVDISDMDQDELQVRCVDGVLIIRAPGNVRYGFSIRRMMLERTVQLPDDVIEDQLQCQLDRYGRLKITAPRKLVTKYDSGSEEDASEDENKSSQKVKSSPKSSPRSLSPAKAAGEQSPPSATQTEQKFAPKAAEQDSKSSSTRYPYTECDPDVIVEDIFE